MKMYKNCAVFVLLLSSSLQLCSNAPTREEKDLIRMAHERRYHGIRDAVDEVKRGWQVIEYFLKDVRLNNRVRAALSEQWQRMHSYGTASTYLKITEQDVVSIFEQVLMELQPRISYFSKQRALSGVRSEARGFARDPQSEYRSTIEKAQRIIMKNLKAHIPEEMHQSINECTERVCKDGIRFMLYQLLLKHNNGFNRYDVRFINAKLEMLLAQWNRDYPYVSVSTYESWAYGLLQDLLFAECAVCMNHKADSYMSCCKSKSICRSCYRRVTACPFCRAPKRRSVRS